jgi:hypothetical protein
MFPGNFAEVISMRVNNISVQGESSDQDSDEDYLDHIPNIMRQKSGIADQTIQPLAKAKIRPKIFKQEQKSSSDKAKYQHLKQKMFNNVMPKKINQNCIAETREITKKSKERQENVHTAASTQQTAMSKLEDKKAHAAEARVKAIDEILDDDNFDENDQGDFVYDIKPVKSQIERLEGAMKDLHDKMSKYHTPAIMKALKSVTVIKLFGHIIPLDDRPLSMDIKNLVLLKKEEV